MAQIPLNFENAIKKIGVGPYCPAALSRTEERKALNRRVEVVEQ
jgi:outer membrane protein OmpA-like peptidoglycan-associated protein